MDIKHIIPGGRVPDVAETRAPTPGDASASEMRAALTARLSRIRREQGVSQKRLESLSGVKQPVIARMEKGRTNPRLDTFLKALAPLGKTLRIGDLPGAEDE
ncbi:MAG: helix-turn-helix transcriptional regulator [Oscillospiraceae bacterium]|nr:helix-turn-helix transcriptional regulator [Oscillospiraceae bacterium]